jgi:hypothetical protein
MKSISKGRKAWLVTWEWCGDHAKREPKVAAVFRPQLSGERVRELVEILYGYSEYSLLERVNFTLSPKTNPYPARFGDVNGVQRAGMIHCGHHPFLLARRVDDLVIGEKDDASWTERKPPHIRTLS